MEHCPEHEQLMVDTAIIKTTIINLDKRINGSIDAVEKHIKDGKTWRAVIISVGVAVVFNVISFAYMYGKLCQRTDNIAYAVEKIEELFPRTRGIQGIQGIQGVPGKDYGK